MSTSVRNLTGIQILFKRPAFALGVIFIIGMILFKPTYNTLPILLAIPTYWVMYQLRYNIYKLGIARFDLLSMLIYLSIVLSFLIPWEYKNNVVMPNLGEFSFNNIANYSGGIFSLIGQSLLDIKTHWKTIIFTPAFASVLYFIFIELDRKSVKKTDLYNLELTENSLFKRGSTFDGLGTGFFLVSSFLYGAQVGVIAVIILAMFLFLARNIYIWIALILSIGILVWNFTSFDYLSLLAFPTIVHDTFLANGIWHGLHLVTEYTSLHNVGQFYILIPYLLFTSIIALINIKHRVKVEEIAHDEAQLHEVRTTEDAIEFGFEMSSNKLVRLTHKELNTHMYINGASGSGKTVAMLNFVIEAASKKIPLIYIDGKGASDLEQKISKIAAEHNRVFKVFTLSTKAVDKPSGYDFLGSGSFTEKKNRIMQLFITAEEAASDYYQTNLEAFINRVFMLIEYQGLKIDLYRFLDLITNINDLVELASRDIVIEDGDTKTVKNFKSYFEQIRDMKPQESPRTSIITKLDPFIHSSYGHLFDVVGKENVIRIKDSIKNGEIVLFLFDASAYALDTGRVAKMVISDINATFAELGIEKDPTTNAPIEPIKTFCCFDEFKSYETDAISKTIALHRSNGMHAIIGTQSLALIDRNIGNGILTNCQTHLIMASASDDAERFADEFGEMDKMEYTTRVQSDVQEVSDISIRKNRDYIIQKQDIKDIKVNTGQGYLHRKVLGQKPVKIQVTRKV